MKTVSTETLKEAALNAVEAHLSKRREEGLSKFLELEITLECEGVSHLPLFFRTQSTFWAEFMTRDESGAPVWGGAVRVWAIAEDTGEIGDTHPVIFERSL